MTEGETSPAPEADAPKRRRRRLQPSPVEEVSSQVERRAEAKPSAAPVAPSASSWQRWKREALSSFGLSPTFRAYLFVGSILAILALLLYNESITQALKSQEEQNVHLYARLISLMSLADDEPSIAIFQEIIINPDRNFPRIITDHRGRIIQWNPGAEMAALAPSGIARLWRELAFWQEEAQSAVGDSAAIMEALDRLVEQMDAEVPPISFFPVPKVTGRLYSDGKQWIVTDSQGEIVDWLAEDLPTLLDTTGAVRQQVETRLRQLQTTAAPLVFTVPVGAMSHLYHDGDNAIIADRQNAVLAWRGPDLPASTDTTRQARQQVETRLRQMGSAASPLSFEIPAQNYIHYGESELVRRVSQSTFVLIGALVLFLLIGYIGFRNIKRSEQRSIWVGMAKETAHQLGTPLSSLAGWLELIGHEIDTARTLAAANPQSLSRLEEMAGEMHKDMQRLGQIASRFSQIGSVPKLQQADVVAILQETVAYFRRRGSQFGRYEIRFQVHGQVPPIPLNPDLLGWVFENLFKNAIDAIERQTGAIEIHVGLRPDDRAVQITFQDDGRGIAPEHVGRIFDPGFSTKKRGWGLGLAFVKRIVEEYHGGRISIVQSTPGEGATFEIVLPLGKTMD